MMSRRWIGRWVIAVSALHTLFALLAFGHVLRAMLNAGIWNSVGNDVMRGATAWFLLSGGFMLTVGIAIDQCERSGAIAVLHPVGWSLLGVTLVAIFLMPVSGGWLLLPPAIAMILRPKAV